MFLYFLYQPLIQILQSFVRTLRQQAHDVIGPPPHTRYYHRGNEDAFTPAELDRLNGKTFLFVDDHSLLPSTSTNHAISRATSVTISDIAEAHPSTFHTTDNLHPTLAHDLREFGIRNSETFVSPMTFHDLNDRASSDDHSDYSPPPQVVRHTPPEVPKLFFQPMQPRIDPQMHFFHQPYHVEPVIESRRIAYGSGFGGYHAGFGAMPTIVLDPVWHGFAEQLGF